ncbi:MAG: hypothetical protein LBL36_03095, partial [Clostridiales Family XIII bacterium]|nr:hypothetical protein [Clostridiales Family XIII bacterium]
MTVVLALAMIPLPIFANDTPVSAASSEINPKSTLDTPTQTAPAKGTLSLGAQPSLKASNSVVEIGVADVTDTVAKIEEAIQAALDAADEDGSVTVTGSMTGVSETLELNIPEDVKLIWNATYKGTGSSQWEGALIYLQGAGAFEMIGGEISATGDNAKGVYVIDQNFTLMVSGGTISATGAGTHAIHLDGDASYSIVTVSGDATVTANATGSDYCAAIHLGNYQEAVISGGTVNATNSAGESAYGIYSRGLQCEVTVNGGTVSASVTGEYSNSFGISVSGGNNEVTINGGEVSASAPGSEASSYAIDTASSTGSQVTVNKGGTVRSDGYYGYGVYCRGEVVVAGTVTASGGDGGECYGIYGNDSVKVTINGGTVITEEGDSRAITGHSIEVNGESTVSANTSGIGKVAHAIEIDSANGSVTINSGTIIASGMKRSISTIYIDGTNGEVTVNGGTVTSRAAEAGNNDYNQSIYGNDGATINVRGGIVSAVNSEAIRTYSGTINITDGLVFAYGDAILGSGKVIYMYSGSPTITSPGVVIAWDEASYDAPYEFGDDTTDIIKYGSDVTAYWSKKGGENGITYENTTDGTNKGFLALPVEVTDAATIDGSVTIDNEALADTENPPTVTVTLNENYTVADELDGRDVSDWFTDLPEGVTVSATAEAGGDTITLTFG